MLYRLSKSGLGLAFMRTALNCRGPLVSSSLRFTTPSRHLLMILCDFDQAKKTRPPPTTAPKVPWVTPLDLLGHMPSITDHATPLPNITNHIATAINHHEIHNCSRARFAFPRTGNNDQANHHPTPVHVRSPFALANPSTKPAPFVW